MARPSVYLALLLLLSLATNTNIVLEGLMPSFYSAQYHITTAEGWLGGEDPISNPDYYIDGAPYLSTLSLLLAALSAATGIGVPGVASILQLLLFPLALLSLYRLVARRYGPFAGALASTFLFATRPFLGGFSHVTPSYLDYILFPWVLGFYLQGRWKAFIGLATALIYFHGLYPALLVGGLLAHSVREGHGRWRFFLPIGVLCIPLLLVFAPYVGKAVGGAVAYKQNATELVDAYVAAYGPLGYLFHVPLLAISLGYIPALYAAFSLAGLVWGREGRLEGLLPYWLASVAPILILLPFRGAGYMTYPLAVAVGAYLPRFVVGGRGRSLLVAILLAPVALAPNFLS